MATVKTNIANEADLATIIKAYNDVTERLKRSHESLALEVCRLSEELREKNKELQRRERLAALGEMAAGVAHEIRNPLGGILLYVSMLGQDLSDRPKELELVQRIGVGIRNLDGVVSDILAFSGDAEPKLRNFSVRKVIDAMLTQTEPKARAGNIEIKVDPKLEPVELYGDAGQVERALVNLVLNSLEAVDPGGQVRISLGEEHDQGEGGDCRLVRIVVEDDGHGITPEFLHRVFDPFFTTKDTGTGLGLAIVHRIAESNGGFVSAGASSSGGAMFALSLPAARPDGGNSLSGGDE